jgi:acetyltransferase-like isoleucine patch superfamily enzyme
VTKTVLDLRRGIGRLVAAYTWLTSSLSAKFYLRNCTAVGRRTRTFWRPHIENLGRIVVGNRVRLNSHWAPVELVTGPQGVIEIEDNVYINYGTLIAAHRRVRIGADVMVGNYSIIADSEVPATAVARDGPSALPREIEIGAGAWLAARVTVLPGARIGARAVIAAGSIVAGEIPPGVVAGGIPARILRSAPRDAAAAPLTAAGQGEARRS